MIFREPRIVKEIFSLDQIPELKVGSILTLIVPIDASIYNVGLEQVTLDIIITTLDKEKSHVQAFGYFLDNTNWYLTDLFFRKDQGEKHSIVLSPITPPSLRNQPLVDYYERQIAKIPDFASNLANDSTGKPATV